MKKLMVPLIIFAATAFAISANSGTVVIPAKISKVEVAGKIFERENMIETKHESGNVTLDVTTLLSSDKKFASGMYRSGNQCRRGGDDTEGMDRHLGYRRLYQDLGNIFRRRFRIVRKQYRGVT
jgi:hypothetical protein